MRAYLDTSALIKLVIAEQASSALRVYLGDGAVLLTSRLAEIEVTRAIRRHQFETPPDVDALFDEIEFRAIDLEVAAQAGRLKPSELRTLGAIHLATAVELRAELDAFVTYDERLADAARAHRLPVVSPT